MWGMIARMFFLIALSQSSQIYHLPKVRQRESNVFELVHIDTWGPYKGELQRKVQLLSHIGG